MEENKKNAEKKTVKKPAKKAEAPVKICPACGWVSRSEKDVFCKKCGAKLSILKTACTGPNGSSGCGADLTYHDGRFCTHCGAPLFDVSAKDLVEGAADLITKFGKAAIDGMSKFPKR